MEVRTEGSRYGMVAILSDQQASSQLEAYFNYLHLLSHDLNNNLNSIGVHLPLLRQRLIAIPEFSEDLETLNLAQQVIDHTNEGMRRLLTHARLASHDQTNLILQPVSLKYLANDVAAHCRRQAQIKGLGLRAAVPREAMVESDCYLIFLVLQNLVDNSVKYSSKGEIRLEGRQVQALHPAQWVLSVLDQGPGIPPEHLHWISSAFQQGHALGRPGIGLGLAIACEAAMVLGAHVSVESKIGAGTTFHVMLDDRPAFSSLAS